MNKTVLLAVLSVLFVATTISSTPRVHGVLTGTVCIVQSTSSTACPSTPINFLDTAGGTLTVTVFISGSDSLNGVDMSVVTDPTILNPTTISFCTASSFCNSPPVTSVVSSSPLVLIDCVNGAPVANSGGNCNSYDGSGVASVGLLNIGGSTVSPTTGILFTVTYSVLSTAQTGIDVLVNSNCAGQSVSGANDCILVTNGAAVDPETPLAGAPVNGVTDANALATAGTPPLVKDNTSTSVACTPSSLNIGATSTCQATVTDTTNATNTPTGNVTFTSSNTGVATVGSGCSLISGSCSAMLTGVGLGNATVTGTYNGDSTHSTSFGTAAISVIQASVPAVSITSLSPNPAVVGQTVTVSFSVTSSTSLTSLVVLWGDGTNDTLSTSAVSDTHMYIAAGNFTVTVAATNSGGTGSSSSVELVLALHSTTTSIACSPASINVTQTSTCTATVTDTSIAPTTPSGSVTFTSSNTGVGTVGASCALSSGSCSVTFTGVGIGNATVTGTYGGDATHAGSTGTSNLIRVNALLSPVIFFGGKVSWTHHLSLSKTSCNCETWTIKISNPNTVTVYAQVTILAVEGTGTAGFTAMSSVITLTSGQSLTTTMTSPDLSGDIGVKFSFTATIMWGTSPTSLTFPGGNSKSGSFAVVA